MPEPIVPESDQANGGAAAAAPANPAPEAGKDGKPAAAAAPNGQSNNGNAGVAQELFELPDGRKVDAATLSKEWKENFMPEFTKKSQFFKERTKIEAEQKLKAEEATRKAVGEDDSLKDVPPEVKEAIVKIVTPIFEQREKAKAEEHAQKEKEAKFESELVALEGEFKGDNGIPKFDRAEVLKEMQDPNNRIFDPRTFFLKKHEGAVIDAAVKAALKKQSEGGLSPEKTGGGEGARSPSAKTPKTFGEAGANFLQRLKNAEA